MSVSQQSLPESPQVSKRLTLPFVDTGPLFDLQWLILLLPVWWVLGIEQFIWPVGLAYITVKVLILQQWRIRVIPTLKWFGLFLVAVLVSSFFIDETYRWLTYIRNLGAYLAGFLAFLVVVNRAKTWVSVSKLLDAILIVVVLTAIIGLLAIIGLWRPTFNSIAGSLLPGWITATSYGEAIAFREVGQMGWFVGLGEYYRLSGFFLFATHYASVVVYAIPFLLFRLAYSTGVKRLLIGSSIILLLLNLVYTTGRVSMVGLITGGIYFMLFQSLSRKLLRFLSVVGFMILLLGLLLTAFAEYASPTQDGVFAETVEAAQTFLFARGTGSFTNRFAVYEASLQGFGERPLFGWGTERDLPGLELPAGSHSEYIAVLYRQGLFGIIAFIGLMWSTWRYSRPVSDSRKSTEQGSFLRYGRWFFVTALVNSIAADPVIDTTVYVFLWLLLALLVATAQTMRKETHDAAISH